MMKMMNIQVLSKRSKSKFQNQMERGYKERKGNKARVNKKYIYKQNLISYTLHSTNIESANYYIYNINEKET